MSAIIKTSAYYIAGSTRGSAPVRWLRERDDGTTAVVDDVALATTFPDEATASDVRRDFLRDMRPEAVSGREGVILWQVIGAHQHKVDPAG